MNRRAKVIFPFLCCLFSLSTLPSCKQGEGERCEINSDCGSGLICDVSVGGGSSNGVNGICRSSTSSTTTPPDASVRRDSAITLDTKADRLGMETSMSVDSHFNLETSPPDAVSMDGTNLSDGKPAIETGAIDHPVIVDVRTSEDIAADVPLPMDTAQDQMSLGTDATRLD